MSDEDKIVLSAVRRVPAAVIRSGVQRVFCNRLQRAKGRLSHAILVSPWISAFHGYPYSLERLVAHLNRYRLRTYVFVRPPQNESDNEVLEILSRCRSAEISTNRYLHAKAYVCVGPSPHGFGIVSSSNFTEASSDLYELGLLVSAVGPGSQIVQQMSDFALSYLRTRPETTVFKKMDFRSAR